MVQGFEGGPTCESEGEKSGGSPSAYHCAWRLMLTRGMNRLNTCVSKTLHLTAISVWHC